MKLRLLVLLFFFSIAAFGQNKGFTYQAIIVDNLGKPIVSKSIKVQFSIIPTAATNTAVYSEEHTVTTSETGEINLVIGTSTTVLTGTNLSAVNWNVNPMYLLTKVDVGAGFKSLGATQLQVVPYALHAANGVKKFEKKYGENTADTLQLGDNVDIYQTYDGAWHRYIKLPKPSAANSQLASRFNTTLFVNCQSTFWFEISKDNTNLAANLRLNTGDNALFIFYDNKWNLVAGVSPYKPSPSTFTDSNNNSTLGINSLTKLTTGGNNIGIGTNSLVNVTTGSDNVALGVGALNTSTTASGNVAIGKDALNKNTSGFYNAAFGTNALRINTTGGLNTAIGYGTMVQNTIGSNNTAVGQGSMQVNVSGNNNSAFGTYSLDNNTSGSNNTSIGYFTLQTNSTGSNNTSLGSMSLFNNLSGSQNTAIGYSSLNSAKANGWNTAVGYNSLLKDTVGIESVAIGWNSLLNNQVSASTGVGSRTLENNTTGRSNTAVGFSALFSNQVGFDNSAVGESALYSNLSNSNVAVGNYALQANTTGTNNLAVGKGAGVGNTIGSFNSFLGASANATSGTISNSTAIGFNAQVSASNQVQIGNTDVTLVKSSGIIESGKGILPPKISESIRNAITNPPTGLIIYCNNCGIKGQMQYFDGYNWVDMMGGTPVAALNVGSSLQGGVIGYILQQGDPGYDPNILHGFIVSTADLNSATWCNGAYSFTGAVSAIIGSGFSNTNTIVTSQGAGLYAAKLCRDYNGGGYTDWFLPSEDELYKMWLNRVAIGGLGGLSGVSRPYWSSTDYNPVAPSTVSAGARYIEFGNGARNGGDKFSLFRVRAIRNF